MGALRMSAIARVGATRRAVLLFAAFLVGAGVGGIYLIAHGEQMPPQVRVRGQASVPGEGPDLMAIFDPSQPLMIDGMQVTLDQAASFSGYPVYRPAAMDSVTPEVWFSQDTDEVGLRYGSSLVLLLSRWPAGMDPSQSYRQQAADWHAGYATTITGYPAWVVPQDAQAAGFPPVNVVHVTIGDVEVTLFGQMPLDALLGVAETLRA